MNLIGCKRFIVLFLLIISFDFAYSQNLLNDSLKSLLLSKHNFYRKAIGNKELQWSEQLENIAKEEENKLIANPNNYYQTDLYGENIFKSVNFPEIDEIMQFWLREQKYYHGEILNEQGLSIYSHYTQLIWRQTTVLGCALGQTKGQLYVLICLYSPKGNIVGQKP